MAHILPTCLQSTERTSELSHVFQRWRYVPRCSCYALSKYGPLETDHMAPQYTYLTMTLFSTSSIFIGQFF
jgi:hypothetical protein